MTIWICAAALLAALAVWIYFGNVTIGVTTYNVTDADIPRTFDGFTIAQISDLHNSEPDGLITALEAAAPDMIAVTGDLIDSRRTDVDAALSVIRQAADIAPVYYVTGNHEARIPVEYARLESGLEALGVRILHNECTKVSRGGESIAVAGLDAPTFGAREGLELLPGFTVLLAHHPEHIGDYAAMGADIALCGHTHGGQIRLPLIGGLFAPGQGFFPKYDAGRFELGGTTMIVSRGLGNSLFPFRVNDPPELVVVKLCFEP